MRYSLFLITLACASAQPAGFLTRSGRTLFPVGCYELPNSDAELKRMAEAGFNLFRCGSRADLDRVAAAGIQGWVPLPLAPGKEDVLRRMVTEMKDHPALAVWEGPDELVWNFTAYSGLARSGAHKQPGEWWKQTPGALAHAAAEAAKAIPAFRQGADLVRSLDRNRHPLWMNEAAESDMKYIREYLDKVDILGCDVYPIRAENPDPISVADYTGRYRRVGKGKPVWMVLQGFSWHNLPDRKRGPAYPSFGETRLMAYASIARGARGILYWGTSYLLPADTGFRQSLLAMAAELEALQPLLTAPDVRGPAVSLVESDGRPRPGDRGVQLVARSAGGDWLLILVNEDSRAHMGVEVTGLEALDGRSLPLLYTDQSETVKDGGLVIRMLPLEIKVFATSRKWETARRAGREFTWSPSVP